MSLIDNMVQKFILAENELIEAACERMLVTPERVGVLVLRYENGVSVGLDYGVAPMQITVIEMGVLMPARGPE